MRARIAALLLVPAACAPAAREGEGAQANVLFVTIDTLRADHLGAYGYARDTSPELDRLARRSVVFENAQAQTSWTLGSLASLVTSRWVGSLGIQNFRSRLDGEATTLCEVLAREGWETAGVGTHLVFQEKYGLRQGIGEFDDELVASNYAESHRAVTSERVSDKALAWISERPDGARPWFLWLHYFDPHIPYVRHAGISERFGDSGLDRYDGEIAFTDRHLGRVLRELERRRSATVIVVTSDHGEEFGDHGGHEHGHTLYQELVRVPLIVSAPSLAPARVVERVRLVDVFPSLLELLDVPRARWPKELVGESFAELARGSGRSSPRPALAELRLRDETAMDGLVSGRWKLVVSRSTRRVELYDLERDPREQKNLARAEPERLAELSAVLEALLAESERGAEGDAEGVLLSPEEIGALRDLGYLGDLDDDGK